MDDSSGEEAVMGLDGDDSDDSSESPWQFAQAKTLPYSIHWAYILGALMLFTSNNSTTKVQP